MLHDNLSFLLTLDSNKWKGEIPMKLRKVGLNAPKMQGPDRTGTRKEIWHCGKGTSKIKSVLWKKQKLHDTVKMENQIGT